MTFKPQKELLALDDKGLTKELTHTSTLLNNISFDNSQHNLKDTSQIKKAKKYIALIRTICHQRELEKNLKANL